MRAVIPDRKAADPSDSPIDALDVLERRFLEHPETTNDLKDGYYGMSTENRKQFLVCWESQRADEERGQIVPV
jgi:hypothetical protein